MILGVNYSLSATNRRHLRTCWSHHAMSTLHRVTLATTTSNSTGASIRHARSTWLLLVLWGYRLQSCVRLSGVSRCLLHHLEALLHVLPLWCLHRHHGRVVRRRRRRHRVKSHCRRRRMVLYGSLRLYGFQKLLLASSAKALSGWLYI